MFLSDPLSGFFMDTFLLLLVYSLRPDIRCQTRLQIMISYKPVLFCRGDEALRNFCIKGMLLTFPIPSNSELTNFLFNHCSRDTCIASVQSRQKLYPLCTNGFLLLCDTINLGLFLHIPRAFGKVRHNSRIESWLGCT